jgi:hypothetical protein
MHFVDIVGRQKSNECNAQTKNTTNTELVQTFNAVLTVGKACII